MRAALALLLAALVAPASGCLACQPQLDVHRCRDDTGRCDTSATKPVAWEPGAASLFPDVARLMEGLEPGLHAHAGWTQEQEEAFWAFYHVPADEPEKQVLLDADGALFQVRVLAC